MKLLWSAIFGGMSNEHFLRQAYQQCFDRKPDEEGYLHHLRALDEKSVSRLALLYGFKRSDEGNRQRQKRSLLAKSADLNNEEFLTWSYRRIFGRKPDRDGYECYLDQLANGTMSRGELIELFLTSSEPRFKELSTFHALALRFFPGKRRVILDRYKYQFSDDTLSYHDAIRALRARIRNTVIADQPAPMNGREIDRILSQLKELGIKTGQMTIDTQQLHAYLIEAGYDKRYPDYYKDNFAEKTLEHYIGYTLLDPKPGEVFVDIASEHAPVPEIFQRLTGCDAYAQDLMFEPGLHGKKIGGDAGNMPVPDHFIDKAYVGCSLEHFEGDADTRFMLELQRVLKPGGKVLIAPFYLRTEACVQTDPRYAVAGQVEFDEGIPVYCVKDWGNRHGRYYSLDTLSQRLIKTTHNLEFTVHHINNLVDVGTNLYCSFALVIKRR